ncbi:hypothetical protein BASA81_008748 [Batrachochytrium salamandrivorans]|nr:hypothetical protein BASA81_008748 [Batrachochytrium salamandrivorans]
MMQSPSSFKKATCQICRSPYRVIHRGQTQLYRLLVRVVSLLSLGPIAMLAAEIVPSFPLRGSREVDIFGFDLEEWSPEAFGWLFGMEGLQQIATIVRNKGGAWKSIRSGSGKVWPIVCFGLAKAGSLGVLLQFFMSNFTVGEHNFYYQHLANNHQAGGRLERYLGAMSPGKVMLLHYVFYCVALRCCQTPKSPRGAVAFSLMCSWGCWFEASLVEGLIRRTVLRLWPNLEVAQLAG